MKIKYECEADENGYTERLIIDGVVKFENVNEKTDCGTKQISGTSLEDLEEVGNYTDSVIDALYDDLPSFLGMNLCRVCEDMS